MEIGKDALQRGTFLWERDTDGAVSTHDSSVLEYVKGLMKTEEGRQRLEQAACQLRRHSSTLSKDGVFPWTEVLWHLCADVDDRPVSIGDLLAGRFVEEPYAIAFRRLALNFARDLLIRQGDGWAAHAKSSIAARLAGALLDRAVQASRYALHILHSRSRETYSRWCRRFDSVCGSRDFWREAATEFPVLIRILDATTRNLDVAMTLLFDRLDADRDLLEQELGVPRGAGLTKADLDLSDPHRGGQTVVRLVFDSGHRLIYKPKSLHIEAAFNGFLRNRIGLGLLPLAVLSRDGYGWVEDAGELTGSPAHDTNDEAVGRSAACFWLLNATDLHLENVRATKAGVHALDLETLLSAPVINGWGSQGPRWRQHSVGATLLFGTSISPKGRSASVAGFDVGAFRRVPPPVVFELRNDAVRMVVPEPSRDPIAPRETRDSASLRAMGAGFAAVCSTGREELRRFVEDLPDETHLRLVLRDTSFYGQLLERIRQPRFLRDGALLSLDLLALHAGVHEKSPISGALHRIVDSEIEQLLQGDVPFFWYRAGSRELQTPRGSVGTAFELSGKQHALNKLHGVEDSDVQEQIALMGLAGGLPPQQAAIAKGASGADDFGGKLAQLAEHIVEAAYVPNGAPARWLSLFGDVGGEDLKVGVGDTAFFGGSWGILLALQAVDSALAPGACRSVSRFLDEQALQWAACDDAASDGSAALGFAGIGGEVFAWSTLAMLQSSRWSFLDSRMRRRLKHAQQQVGTDALLDVIGGSAGLILGCVRALEGHASASTRAEGLRAVSLAVRHLQSRVHLSEGAVSWKVPDETQPLLGYAHGWAGVVAALVSCRKWLPPEDGEEIDLLIERAAAFPDVELGMYGDWVDHRGNPAGRSPLNASWCNGASGFLRGLLSVRDLWRPLSAGRFDAQLTGVGAPRSQSNAFRFCCGEIGKADLLLDWTRATGSKAAERDVREAVDRILRSVLGAFGSSHPDMPELVFPGLFQGHAGIAYTGARCLLPSLPSLSGHRLAPAV